MAYVVMAAHTLPHINPKSYHFLAKGLEAFCKALD